MARIRSSKIKLCRRERYDLFPRLGDTGQSSKRTQKRGAPGEHPMFARPTLYATQFREKQKVKRIYGLLEKQFRRFYQLASKQQGQTGLALLQLLEKRLDNVVFRSGLAKTRDHARQIVNHGHVKVNGKRMNIPSYIVEDGDKVELSDKLYNTPLFEEIKRIAENYQVPTWLNKTGERNVEVTGTPVRDDIDMGISEQLIVEFYSK